MDFSTLGTIADFLAGIEDLRISPETADASDVSEPWQSVPENTIFCQHLRASAALSPRQKRNRLTDTFM
jgi:hypothetical protein